MMKFEAFKEKVKQAGLKMGMLSKGSYSIVCEMIPSDETIVCIAESYPAKISGISGGIILTDKRFYGQIPLADKTFQSIVIDRSEIIGLMFPEGKEKTLKLQTNQGVFDIGQILSNLQQLVQLINQKETIVVSSSSSQEGSSLNPLEKEPNIESEQSAFSTMDLKKLLTAKSVGELIYGEQFTHEQEAKKAAEAEKKLRCPKCGSENIEPMPVTKGKTKGFGLGKASVGGLALGPVGLAAGVIGMGKGKTKTDIVWICKSCANKFAKPKKE
jgi:ribosomal protein L37AE/L43A